MRLAETFAALVGLVGMVNSHYTFNLLVVNGAVKGSASTYVKPHQNSYMPTKFKNTPSGSITPNDSGFRCNKGATSASSVYTVKTGDKVALKQAFGGTGMAHPGPAQVYTSKTSGSAQSYTGDGNWYKIHQALLCKNGSAEQLRSTSWCNWMKDSIEFTIPSTIPNGNYLFRAEHISLHGAHLGEAEFYYACAQITVTGNSATSIPGTAVRFPGAYKATDPAINYSLWGSATDYQLTPGPAVIKGGTIRGSPAGYGGDAHYGRYLTHQVRVI